jgi:hypothetical protein
MNTMPFPDGIEEVPRGLLVALPEFRLEPLNGRTAPIIAIFGQNGHSQKLPFENEHLTVSAPMDTRQ